MRSSRTALRLFCFLFVCWSRELRFRSTYAIGKSTSITNRRRVEVAVGDTPGKLGTSVERRLDALSGSEHKIAAAIARSHVQFHQLDIDAGRVTFG